MGKLSMRAIAIDGPAGAGKSTIAKRVSAKLGYIYVDTGALYRAVGYTAMTKGVSLEEIEAVLPYLADLAVTIRYVDGVQHVFVNGEDVSSQIRTQEVAAYASKVSALPEVRQFLFDLQQQLARENNVVMDGRDIGTVVLPEADVKIYLTASVEERARRRCKELQEKGAAADLAVIAQEIAQRDYADMNRAIAPLKRAADAVFVDSSDLNLEQAVEAVEAVIRKKIAE